MNKEGLTAAACTVGIAIPKGSYLYIQELVMLIAVHSSRCRSVLCCAAHSTWLSGLHIFLGHRVNLAAISKGPCRPLPLDKGKDSTFVPLSQCKAVCLMGTSFCLTVEMDMALKKIFWDLQRPKYWQEPLHRGWCHALIGGSSHATQLGVPTLLFVFTPINSILVSYSV